MGRPSAAGPAPTAPSARAGPPPPAVAALEARAVTAAEAGDVERAVGLLTEAIALAPSRAAAYNNRAQALRMLHDPDAAMADLDAALALPTVPVDVKRKALVQRAMIWELRGESDRAFADMSCAAELGCPIAREHAARLNPVAKLCSSMVRTMMQDRGSTR